MMKKLAAVILCLMLCACALCEEASIAPAIQAPVPEVEAFALRPEESKGGALEIDAPEDTVEPGPEVTATPEDTATPGIETTATPEGTLTPTVKPTATPRVRRTAKPTATPQPPLKEKAFDATKVIKTQRTYRRLNLVRQEGFDGKLAEVRGTLTLVQAQIEGVPARKVKLLKVFKLGPTGCIVVEDDAPLAADASAFSFNKGDRRTLRVSYNGKSISGKKIQWSVSNDQVIQISAKGVVKALKKGQATITGTYKGQKLKCYVVVTDIIHVKDIELSATELELSMNRTVRLRARLSPKDTTEKTVKWKSGNPAVATVDEMGYVTGVSEGTTRIRATAVNGKKVYCKVTVKEIEPTDLDFDGLYCVARMGETTVLKPELEPENCSYPELRFTSSNKSVATIDRSTGEVTPVSCGWTTITVTSRRDPDLSDTCRLCVIKAKGKRLSGLVIGLNPGHQRTTISRQYPMAPGSSKKGYGVKTGACGHWTRVNEYETVLAVGLKLRDKLKALGAKVVITRTDNDVMLTNIDRARILNEAEVDIALQLHCNATNKDPRPEGCSTYYRDNSDWVPESRACARILADTISEITDCKNNGHHVHNNYMSLNWSETPAVLVEMGYISNKREDRLLASDEYRDLMADAIVEALCRHFGR